MLILQPVKPLVSKALAAINRVTPILDRPRNQSLSSIDLETENMMLSEALLAARIALHEAQAIIAPPLDQVERDSILSAVCRSASEGLVACQTLYTAEMLSELDGQTHSLVIRALAAHFPKNTVPYWK